MNIQQQILEAVAAGVAPKAALQASGPEMVEYHVRRMVNNGQLESVDGKLSLPVEDQLPVHMPDIPASLNWPTDSQMSELMRSPQYEHRGGVCPTCGKREGSDAVGTFQYGGQTWVCPDDERGHIRLRLAYHYWLAGIPVEYQTLVWDTYPHSDQREEVKLYIDRIERMSQLGMGFLVSGEARGTGKTWLTAHVLKEAVKRGYTGWWAPFSDVARLYEMEDRKERDRIYDKMRGVQHLVIDDVLRPVSDKQRDLYESKWEEVLRYRTVMGFPTHISTNLTEAGIEKHFPRVYSLLSAKQFGVELTGDDARMLSVRERNVEMAMGDEMAPIT